MTIIIGYDFNSLSEVQAHQHKWYLVSACSCYTNNTKRFEGKKTYFMIDNTSILFKILQNWLQAIIDLLCGQSKSNTHTFVNYVIIISNWISFLDGTCHSNPCLNGGTCRINYLDSDHTCFCSPGFTGHICETGIYLSTNPYLSFIDNFNIRNNNKLDNW